MLGLCYFLNSFNLMDFCKKDNSLRLGFGKLTVGIAVYEIDPFKIDGEADEKVKLAHELGHFETERSITFMPFVTYAQSTNAQPTNGQ